MTIADKLTAIAENVQKVYEAGKAASGSGDDPLYYAYALNDTFRNAVFPADTCIELKLQKIAPMQHTFAGTKNLKKVTLISEDTTTEPYYRQTFRESNVEIIDLTKYNRKLNANMSYFVYNANSLKSILGALDFTNCTDTTYAFLCSSLVDVELVPNTVSTDIRFSSAYLSDASIQSIIDGLADLTGGTAKTLTLNGVGSKLTDAQKAAITAKNWTLAV